jgi:hypothetical protein
MHRHDRKNITTTESLSLFFYGMPFAFTTPIQVLGPQNKEIWISSAAKSSDSAKFTLLCNRQDPLPPRLHLSKALLFRWLPGCNPERLKNFHFRNGIRFLDAIYISSVSLCRVAVLILTTSSWAACQIFGIRYVICHTSACYLATELGRWRSQCSLWIEGLRPFYSLGLCRGPKQNQSEI